MLRFITFARLGATAGAINFNKEELIPSSPVKHLMGVIWWFLKLCVLKLWVYWNQRSCQLFLRFTKSTKLVRSGSVLIVLSMMLSAIEIKCSLNMVQSLVREFIRLICFALVGKIFFKVFHRTLEFNLLLSISLIIASFLAFSISLTTLFLAAFAPFEIFLEPIVRFDCCENFIQKPRWFLHRFNSDWFKWSVSIYHIEYKGFPSWQHFVWVIVKGVKDDPWLGTSFKSLMKLLTFNLFKGRYVTVKIRSKQGSFMKYDAKICVT